MGESRRQQTDLIAMLPPGMGNGLPARYRPGAVALFLFLERLNETTRKGFFVNVDADSLPEFWKQWPSAALESAKRVGVWGDAPTATAAMLHGGMSEGSYYGSAHARGTL